MDKTFLTHFLATLQYRTAKATTDPPPGFGEFGAGAGVRTPVELMRHMRALMTRPMARILEKQPVEPGPADFGEEVRRFEVGLAEFSEVLRTTELSTDAQLRLLQGPLSDAMTHSGQLSMLRRLAGSAIPPENFMAAPIGGDE